MVAVRGSLTPLVGCSMTRCVGGLSATSWEVQILFVVLVGQSTLIMSMALVSHTAPPANTSGPSANGLDELSTNYSPAICPCVTGSTNRNNIPSFVGQNYFCESGITQWNGTFGILWPDGDPLWDGQGCGPTSSCCTFNSPPWFNVRLPFPTTDNIEVRICGEHSTIYIDSPIHLIELYVK